MIATPAWPPRSTARLFVPGPLSVGALTLDGAAAHYLGGVMRATPGDPVRLFDDLTGEWLAEVESVARRSVTLAVRERLCGRDTVPDIWVCFAPLKKGPIDYLAEKTCELGVAQLMPVITHRTIVDRVNTARLRSTVIEAAEQCGRTALPTICEALRLPALLKTWPAKRALFFADETGGTPARAAMTARAGPGAILIGPEGGFDDAERAAIRAHPAAVAITLGPRILRAETAAAAALSVWMTAAGDW